MPKVWNIGNTTVRNPKRIENALRVFRDEGFSGNARGSETEARLHGKLKQREVLEFDGAPSEWNGRKWRAAFYQLGFISYVQYKVKNETMSARNLFAEIGLPEVIHPYQITPAGLKLITALKVPEIEEIYLRQFTCYEIPNSLERRFQNGKMKPFILFLEVLVLLQNNGLPGLSKFETGLFIQKFRDHTNTLASEIVQEILLYRDRISNCKAKHETRTVKDYYIEELRVFANINPDSIVKDYSDTTFRYFSLSGLFTRSGERIIIRPNKIDSVNKLLESEPSFLYSENPTEYFSQFYRNTYRIPIDTKEFALREIEFLKDGIRDKANPLLKRANDLSEDTDLEIIQALRYELIEYNNWEREEDFAIEQQDEESIKEILLYLKTLNGEKFEGSPEIDDRPAFLEWAVWRSFLAIDEIISPIYFTRRFPIDQDFMPRNTAPGGGADMVFEFDTYVLVVEVTLTTSHRQMAVESEPVRRHTVKYRESYTDKDVYCLFVAPSIDNNVAETFRIGVWYNGDDEEFVNIIPMSLSDFIATIETFLHKRFKNHQFKGLLDRCLIYRNVRAPQWKNNISREVNDWKHRILIST